MPRAALWCLLGDGDSIRLRHGALFLLQQLSQRYQITLLLNAASRDSLYAPLEPQLEAMGIRLFFIRRQPVRIRQEERSATMLAVQNQLQDLTLPDSTLPLWHMLLPDDWVGSYCPDNFILPLPQPRPAAILAPVYAADRCDDFISLVQLQLRQLAVQQGIVMLGLETQGLAGPYSYPCHLFDGFLLHSVLSARFLHQVIGTKKAAMARLPARYQSTLSESTLPTTASLNMLHHSSNLPDDGRARVAIIHSLTDRYAIRQIIRTLIRLPIPLQLVLVCHPEQQSLYLSSRQIAEQAYQDEWQRRPQHCDIQFIETPWPSDACYRRLADVVIHANAADLRANGPVSNNSLLFDPHTPLHMGPWHCRDTQALQQAVTERLQHHPGAPANAVSRLIAHCHDAL